MLPSSYMEKIFLFTLTFTLMISVASAEEFLTTKCSTLIQNDLTNSIQVVDIDGDGVPNILFATGVMGNLHNYVYKDVDCTQEWNNLKNGWTFATPGDVKSFVVTDLDKDGRTDIIVNSIDSSRNKGTPKEYVYVITDKGLVNWNFNKECGLSASVGAGDLDGSGIQNVVLGTKNSKVCALADTVKQKDPVLWSFSTKYPVNHVVVDDFTGDGKMEVLAYAGKYLIGEIYLIDNKGELIWNKEIAGGTFIGVNPSNVIQVAKMGDIGLSTIIGTYEDGLKVFDSKGALSWSYKTDKLISSVEVSDLDNDGKNEVIFGSSPDITVLDNLGQKIWTYSTKEDKTIYSISTSDINGDGIKEVAVGTTRLIYILSDGKLMGEWKYTVEIQGLTKAYEERDADAVAIKLSDLDKDGRVELAAA